MFMGRFGSSYTWIVMGLVVVGVERRVVFRGVGFRFVLCLEYYFDVSRVYFCRKGRLVFEKFWGRRKVVVWRWSVGGLLREG